MLLHLLLTVPLLLSPSAASNNNAVTTVKAPLNGTIADALPGNQVVCSSTNWYDLVWFYFANYILHALSVRALPGENQFTSLAFKLVCLLIPYTGLRRGLCLVARASNLTRHDLQAAARANALCMVIRGDNWRPRNEDEIEGCTLEKVAATAQTERTATSSASSSGDDPEKKQEADTHVQESEVKGSRTWSFKVGKSKTAETLRSVASRLSAEEAETSIAFRLKDSYEPPTDRTFIDKLYRWFVETYKFGRKSLSVSLRLDPDYVKVHGLCNLAPGYELIYVPADIKVTSRSKETPRPPLLESIKSKDLRKVIQSVRSQTRLSSSQSLPRLLFSIVQIVSGAWSLYRAQGLQIERFGFAAYGLTVLPYMIVSIFNFAGSLLTKEYEMVFLVHSTIMDEMISRGGSVDGVVGTVDPQPEDLAEPNCGPPSTSSLGVLGVDQAPRQLLSPTGSTLQFRCADDATPVLATITEADEAPPNTRTDTGISFRDAANSPSSTTPDPNSASKVPPGHHLWSRSLTLAQGVLPSQAPTTDAGAVWRGWAAWKRWYRIKYKHQPLDDPPGGLTIVHVPCHGSLIRLPPPVYESLLRCLTLVMLVAAIAVPIVVITVLTGWRARQSEVSHRSAVLNWIFAGMVLGYWAGSVENLSGNKTVAKGLMIMFVSYGSYCLVGFVTVAQEMIQLGTCRAL